ncbi:MAG: cupin domain-containing protein [Anaerolineae bacterium]|nr:cupin domain-containing protein [Anaerolineae bacterium]MCO5194396.1 cupin domain-containing protein [Anaerolineae bacterium]MCO5198117.1 cupin domain-containing protein [Anaerolineae bacterium]MCO5204710.1 cupin domain-containing protein [Anaerolineae bacterium]
MKITRIYTDADGETHFGELNIPLKDAGTIGLLSQLQPATGIIFRETPGTYNYDWHNTPRRQYVIMLEGGVDFTVSDGETRRFGSGDVVLLEDTAGKGHASKAVDGQPRKSIFVTLD